MKRNDTLTLINGTFTTDEATQILTNVFTAKIEYHQLKNLSSQERFGKDDKTASERIPDLKMNLEKLKEIISEAKATNKEVVIHSEIKISLSDY
ncbi:MAG: hypothetical protein ACFCUU_19380 [Cyclobacteriaceae bacterium]